MNIITYLFTNGSFLNKENVRLLQGKDIKIYVSIDGVKESNDKYRKIRGSKNSAFEVVIKNLEKLSDKQKSRMGINMVVGPENCSFLMENIKFFHKMGFYSIDLSLLGYYAWPLRATKQLEKELEKFIKHYKRIFYRFSKEKPFFMYQLAWISNGKWGYMDKCDRIKIGPDGRFYFCDAFFSADSEKRAQFSIGDIKAGFDISKIDALKKEARENIQKIFPSRFSEHEFNKRIYCPYGVYYYAKVNNQEINELLKRFYESSGIYSKFIFKLYNSLKNNEKFKEFYAIKNKEKGSECLETVTCK